MKMKNFITVTTIIFVLSISVSAQSKFLIDGLKMGKYSVGFRSEWKVDKSRSYLLKMDSINQIEIARPILYNIWYPSLETNTKKMRYGEYLDIITNESTLKAFSEKLLAYNLDVLSNEFLGKKQSDLSSNEKELFENFLDMNTNAIKNAPFQNQKFPLLIYHSGAGSSFEDNAIFFEFLASYGFVIIDSAFQKGDGSRLSIDAGYHSFLDIDFLIDQASELPFVDIKNIYLGGHSAGAQTILSYELQKKHSKIKKLLILDTTMDIHYSLEFLNTAFGSLATNIIKNSNKLKLDMQVFAGPRATFRMYNGLNKSNRWLVSIKGLSHNQYISQGIITEKFFKKETVNEDLDQLEFQYSAMCKMILQYLKEQEVVPINDIVMEHLKPHHNGTIHIASNLITPRQHMSFYSDWGAKAALEILKKLKLELEGSENVLLSSEYAFIWLFELISLNKMEDARLVFQFYDNLGEGQKIIRSSETWLRISKLTQNETLEKICNNHLETLKTFTD